MAGQAAGLIALALAGVAAGAVASDPVTALAGRYSAHFENGMVDGSTYWSDDVFEIVPIDTRHAYVRAEINFFNGHSCSLTGVAAAEGGALIYRDPAPADDYNSKCVLTVQRAGKNLAFDDGDGGCKRYCGARGSFHHENLPWASKRPIRYLARLKGSTEFQAALTEWRTGKPK